jgi:hypothetical protein
MTLGESLHCAQILGLSPWLSSGIGKKPPSDRAAAVALVPWLIKKVLEAVSYLCLLEQLLS